MNGSILMETHYISEQASLGISGYDPISFYSSFELSGKKNEMNWEAWSYYAVDFPRADLELTSIQQSSYLICVKVKGLYHRMIKVGFPTLEHLWQVRDVGEGKLLSLIRTAPENYPYLPIHGQNIRTGLFLHTTISKEQLFAKIPLDNIAAESVVDEFFRLHEDAVSLKVLKKLYKNNGLKYWEPKG